MSAVTKQEIVEALRGPIGAVGNAKRKELANRIELHGIAYEPDGRVIIPIRTFVETNGRQDVKP